MQGAITIDPRLWTLDLSHLLVALLYGAVTEGAQVVERDEGHQLRLHRDRQRPQRALPEPAGLGFPGGLPKLDLEHSPHNV